MKDEKIQDVLDAVELLKSTQREQARRISTLRRKLAEAELDYRGTAALIDKMLNLPIREFV